MPDLAPCPFCASSDVQLVKRHYQRHFLCGNCHVLVRPPSWQQSDEDAAAFWNRCRRPGAHTLDPYLVSERVK